MALTGLTGVGCRGAGGRQGCHTTGGLLHSKIRRLYMQALGHIRGATALLIPITHEQCYAMARMLHGKVVTQKHPPPTSNAGDGTSTIFRCEKRDLTRFSKLSITS